MKLKLDENLPIELVPLIALHGHDVDTVPGENLAGKPDAAVWQAAQRLLVTQDMDFSDVRRFIPGTHWGILLVRPRLASRRALLARVKSVFATERVEEWTRCFVVVTERKVRVRRP